MKVLKIMMLAFCVLTSISLYAQDIWGNESQNFSEFNSETIYDNSDAFVISQAPTRAAPPGGGTPIGVVTPVKDAYLILFYLVICYGLYYMRKRSKRRVFSRKK